MKSELLAQSPALALPVFALLLFMATFLVALVVTMRRRAAAYDEIARMPLEDDGRAQGGDPHEGGRP